MEGEAGNGRSNHCPRFCILQNRVRTSIVKEHYGGQRGKAKQPVSPLPIRSANDLPIVTLPSKCDECQTILEAFRLAVSEIRVLPKRKAELRVWSGMLLSLGTQEGADEALNSFPFRRQ